jgi:hypothetical protein
MIKLTTKNHLNVKRVTHKKQQSETAIYNPTMIIISEYFFNITTTYANFSLLPDFSVNKFQFDIKLMTKNCLNVEKNSHRQATMM